MPYISQSDRDQWQELLDYIGKDDFEDVTPGDLNYLITKLCKKYYYDKTGPSYGTLNELVGVLECAKLELYRRVLAPYEDKKIDENGDV